MSEWWTYRLSSFLLFSPRTYYRQLELYNLAIWPAQLAGVAIGLAIIALLAGERGRRGRIISGLLAACWLWTAWAFHYQRYAQINWAALWFAAAFAFEALLLIVVGVVAGRLVLQPSSRGELWLATSLVAIVVLAYSLLAPLTGRAWTTAEVFGVAADPTAIASVAVLARIRGRIRWLMLALPLLWCAVTAATLRAMNAPETWIVIATVLLALWPAVRGIRHGAPGATR